jgi:hypothetical protein
MQGAQPAFFQTIEIALHAVFKQFIHHKTIYMLPVIHVSPQVVLPDNDQWQHRFQIESETSNRLYVVAQNRKKGFWACSCPGWKRHRHCKHLRSMGIPGDNQPFEVDFKNE